MFDKSDGFESEYVALIQPTIPRRFWQMKTKAKQDVRNTEAIMNLSPSAESIAAWENAKMNLVHVRKQVEEELAKAQAFRELEDQKIAEDEKAEMARLDAILATAELHSKEWEDAMLTKELAIETVKMIAKVKAVGEARIKEKLQENIAANAKKAK
jgi:hypothetical protein